MKINMHLLEGEITMETRENNYLIMKELKLPEMAKLYIEQSKEPRYEDYSFDNRIAELLNREYDRRNDNTVKKRFKAANLSVSGANLNDLNTSPERKLPMNVLEKLKNNAYIKDKLNVIIIGATGTGKTWLSCAYGSQACLEKYRVKYIRLPEFLTDLEDARIHGSYKSVLNSYCNHDLLILDDFLLNPVSDTERSDIMEILEKRVDKKSTIFGSQVSPEGWHARLGSGTIADAILDRIIYSSYEILLQGKSLREEYSRIKDTK